MCKLKKVTIDYVPVEDRVRLSGECDKSGRIGIWVTRRVLDRLVPVLLDWIEREAVDLPGGGRQPSGETPTPKLTRAEPLHGFAQEAARRSLVRQPRVLIQSQDRSWLTRAVDVKRGPRALQIDFRGEADERAELPLPVQPLRQWLNILHDTYRKAGWSADIWPDWVREAAPNHLSCSVVKH